MMKNSDESRSELKEKTIQGLKSISDAFCIVKVLNEKYATLSGYDRDDPEIPFLFKTDGESHWIECHREPIWWSRYDGRSWISDNERVPLEEYIISEAERVIGKIETQLKDARKMFPLKEEGR